MIGITGVATSGKDTLFNLIENHFKEKKIVVKRFALADILKKDLEPFVREKFNLNIFNLKQEEKELIRPILVAYGKIKRLNSNGRYWIEKLNLNINEYKNEKFIPIITDIRYQEYENDESSWLKKENDGILIHVSRIFKGKLIPPAKAEENKNDIILSKRSDYSITWCTEQNVNLLYKEYKNNLEEIYELYKTRL